MLFSRRISRLPLPLDLVVELYAPARLQPLQELGEYRFPRLRRRAVDRTAGSPLLPRASLSRES